MKPFAVIVVLKVIEHEEAERQKPERKGRVPVIFIEADGPGYHQKHTKRAKIRIQTNKDTNKLLQSIWKCLTLQRLSKKLKEIDCDYDISIMRGMGARVHVDRFQTGKETGQSWANRPEAWLIHWQHFRHFAALRRTQAAQTLEPQRNRQEG